ncbi:MAG: hypothetical protein C0522_01815 [Rhodocyclaceae bacterium]|jgi:hypothetical protein|nr:hypothetical protein [Rhodocyclaceae bacterium]
MSHKPLNLLRAIGLVGTELARAQVGTIRTRLLKIGAVIVRNTRCVRFFLASAFPYQSLFQTVAQRFASIRFTYTYRVFSLLT